MDSGHRSGTMREKWNRSRGARGKELWPDRISQPVIRGHAGGGVRRGQTFRGCAQDGRKSATTRIGRRTTGAGGSKCRAAEGVSGGQGASREGTARRTLNVERLTPNVQLPG